MQSHWGSAAFFNLQEMLQLHLLYNPFQMQEDSKRLPASIFSCSSLPTSAQLLS